MIDHIVMRTRKAAHALIELGAVMQGFGAPCERGSRIVDMVAAS